MFFLFYVFVLKFHVIIIISLLVFNYMDFILCLREENGYSIFMSQKPRIGCVSSHHSFLLVAAKMCLKVTSEMDVQKRLIVAN